MTNRKYVGPTNVDFHFGVNLSLSGLDELSRFIFREGKEFINMEPEFCDVGTKMERKKNVFKMSIRILN